MVKKYGNLLMSFNIFCSVACIAKFSSGQILHHPDFHSKNKASTERFEENLKYAIIIFSLTCLKYLVAFFRRYLTRNIGFEAVMRIRCTEGMHGSTSTGQMVKTTHPSNDVCTYVLVT